MRIAVIALTAVFGAAYAVAGEKAAHDPVTILLFGDSLIAGPGLENSETPAAQLTRYFHGRGDTHVTVIDGGVSGDTTFGGRSRLPWMLKKHDPDIVFISLGGNDGLRGYPADLTRDNVDAMLKMLKEKGVKTVLSQARAPENMGTVYREKLESIFPVLAAEYDARLYPFLLEDVFGRAGYIQRDGIHPTAKGVEIITDTLGTFFTEHF